MVLHGNCDSFLHGFSVYLGPSPGSHSLMIRHCGQRGPRCVGLLPLSKFHLGTHQTDGTFPFIWMNGLCPIIIGTPVAFVSLTRGCLDFFPFRRNGLENASSSQLWSPPLSFCSGHKLRFQRSRSHYFLSDRVIVGYHISLLRTSIGEAPTLFYFSSAGYFVSNIIWSVLALAFHHLDQSLSELGCGSSPCDGYDPMILGNWVCGISLPWATWHSVIASKHESGNIVVGVIMNYRTRFHSHPVAL